MASAPPRRLLARLGLLAGAGIVLSGAAVAWLLRDPEPVFARRTGALVSAVTGAVVRDTVTEEQEVELRSATGLRVSLAVRRPASQGNGTDGSDGTGDANAPDAGTLRSMARADSSTRRPLFLVLGGHQRGKGAAALIGDTRGTIFASMDYPFEGDQRAKGLAVVAQVPAIRRAFYDTPPAVTLALDYLLSRPDVDPTRVELVGASFGAPFATIAAARDPRVTRLWIAHGGGHPYAMIDTGLVKEIPSAVLRAPVSALATLLASGPRFAPEVWIARVAPRPVVMLNALEDERIPRRSVEALWAAARDPREQVWLPGKHMQGNRPDVLRTLVDSVMARAAR